MKFHKTPLHGVYLIEQERRGDERGTFARSFCTKEFGDHGLETVFVQQNVSISTQKGTLRGMHFQRGDDAEVKVIRCARGALYDVLVDIRPDSPTYGKWFGAELSVANGIQMYAPAGTAHGFITLTDDVEATYLVSRAYAPGAEGGLRWNDASVGIEWPIAPTVLSPKDAAWPDFHF